MFNVLKSVCQLITISFYFLTAYGGEPSSQNDFTLDIKMPNITPNSNDQYFCTTKRIDVNEAFIVKFEPHASGSRAHHMILFGSTKDDHLSHFYPNYWDCGHGGLPSGISIMFAWAKNAPPVTLPNNVGFKIGQQTGTKYVILQVHYAKPLEDGQTDQTGLTLRMTYLKQKYLAGIYLLADSQSTIPPYLPKFHVDVNCRYNGKQPIHIFAYRVHAHQLGLVITGYKFNTRNESWTFLAKGNPQWPQAFYPMDSAHTVTNDDILTARCTFNSSSRTKVTNMGFSSHDEMCNLYLMYYAEADSDNTLESTSCGKYEYPRLTDKLPNGSDTPLPRNSKMEDMARDDKTIIVPEDIIDQFSNLVSEISVAKKGNTENSHQKGDDNLIVPQSDNDPTDSTRNTIFDDSYKYNEVPAWPSADITFGQVTAVTLDEKDNVVVFHRGNHIWNERTFNNYQHYMQVDAGPISDHTVITLEPTTGRVIHQWGSNLFYMPHGLTIDDKGNMWLTDVAMHQVFKFNKSGGTKALITLGERFLPGNDRSHFCKPASVVSSTNGDIYIADGYCNTRVVRFSSEGEYISQFGESNSKGIYPPPINTFQIPHKIILAEDEELICVADRENGRIQCFTKADGKFSFQIIREEFHGRLFAVTGTKVKGGLIYAVCGQGYPENHPVQAFVFNLTSRSLLNIITPKQGTFSQPHDLTVTTDGEDLYIVEIGPNKIWKFVRASRKSVKKVLDIVVNKETESLLPPLTSKLSSTVQKSETSSVVAEASSFATSMVIMALLGIPILLLVLITVVVRLKKRGKFQHCSLPQVKGWLGGYRTPRSTQEKFNIGSLLNPHKGFDRVALEESDIEGDEKSDSDIEEFNAVATRKA